MLAPALRLRAHGALRRALDRVVSARQAGRLNSPHILAFGDAALATFARAREELALPGRSFYPL